MTPEQKAYRKDLAVRIAESKYRGTWVDAIRRAWKQKALDTYLADQKTLGSLATSLPSGKTIVGCIGCKLGKVVTIPNDPSHTYHCDECGQRMGSI